MLVVNAGNQNGLIMTVAPGVLATPVDFRILDYVPQPLPPGVVVDFAPVAALPFRIEPADLVLSQSVTLRLPYQPTSIVDTGPGNVEVTQISPYTTRGYDPDEINATEGWVEVGIKTFGQFQVVVGPRLSPLDYTPPLGAVALLAGGYEFEVEEEPTSSPFAAQGGRQWRLTGPQLDERIIFVDGFIVGRRAEPGFWLERWSEPFSPYQQPGTNFNIPMAQTMQVYSPLGSLPLNASLMPFGFYSFVLPFEYDGSVLRDVMKLAINAAYSRADLGSGERRMIYWLSPTRGLLKVSIDGVIYDRIP